MNLENLPLIIYLIDVFSAEGGLVILATLTTVYYVVISCCIAAAQIEDKDKERGEKDAVEQRRVFRLKHTGILALCLIVYTFAVPSKETAYKMLAVYAGTAALDTEIASKLSDTSLKALDTLNRVLDEYAKEEAEKNETN